MKITKANANQSGAIARLIMMAMDYDCCSNLAGESHTLEDFERAMTHLVSMEDSQYSYRNTLVAQNGEGEVVGVCVCYDGKDLHLLRKRFTEEAKEAFGIDYTDMADETQPGELYIDSLAVDANHRRKGIAKELLKAVIEMAKEQNFEKVGLLVDKNNPNAERLYSALGFEYVNDSSWGGHPMKHLQYTVVRDRN